MDIAVIYDTKTDNTAKAAEWIAEGARSVSGADVRTFRIDNVDADWVKGCAAVIVGSPTYMAEMTAAMHLWLEREACRLGLAGKLGGAFATEQYVHGGGERVISSILTFMMVYGMMTYSGGGSKGAPVIHLGPVGMSPAMEDYRSLFETYGRRMAEQAAQL
ncbi:MAG: flavodoxin family protein [Kiritimatiellae bacterium]|nr:flavodoxin family protein [Kiritimatiellia bacterium]